MAPGELRPSWWKRLGWLVLIHAASVSVPGLVALLYRWLMKAAGMTA